jgi:endo-alpha-1,4-polygalactosaminidase (GH114 family)
MVGFIMRTCLAKINLLPIIFIFSIFTLLSCKSSNDSSVNDDSSNNHQPLPVNVAPIVSGKWYIPNTGTTWQWQLQNNQDDELNLSYSVDLYDLDLFDTPSKTIQQLQAEGHKVICYFSAGSYEDWRSD